MPVANTTPAPAATPTPTAPAPPTPPTTTTTTTLTSTNTYNCISATTRLHARETPGGSWRPNAFISMVSARLSRKLRFCKFPKSIRFLTTFVRDAFFITLLSKHEHHHGLGMDALVIVCSQTRTLLRSGQGCTGNHMLSKHKH